MVQHLVAQKVEQVYTHLQYEHWTGERVNKKKGVEKETNVDAHHINDSSWREAGGHQQKGGER